MIPKPGSCEDLIYKALSEAFETLVFEEVVLSEVTSNKLPEANLDGWWASIKMLAPLPWGEIIITVPDTLMNRFTEAILGLVGETPTPEQNFDNLGEILNTICGRLMALRSNPDRVFRIGLPVAGRGLIPEQSCPFRCVDVLVGEEHIYLLAPESFWDDIIWELELS